MQNDFENGPSESERTLQTTGCCAMINAPAHTALSIREFLAKKNIPVLPHPPYSPDLAPCNFSLFPKLKSKLKGHHFGTMENIRKVVTDELHPIKDNDFLTFGTAMINGKTLEPLSNFPRVIL